MPSEYFALLNINIDKPLVSDKVVHLELEPGPIQLLLTLFQIVRKAVPLTVVMTTMMLKRDSQSMNQMASHHVNLHALNIPHFMISQLKKIFR